MRSSTVFSAGGLLLAARLASAQTFTDCNPLTKTCPCEPALGSTLTTDFTKGESSDFTTADGTTMTYDKSSDGGAQFTIHQTEAPTMSLDKYIMFGKVTVNMKAAPGSGVVSSLVLESADLDEIDLEWIGSKPGEVQSNFFGKGNTTSYDRGGTHTVTDAVNSFHSYSIDWTKDYIHWAIDDVVVRTVLYGDAVALGGKNFPQTPMQIKLGNWVGCADAAAAASDKLKYTCEWAGGPLDLTKAPYVMTVKSVTVQDYSTGGEYCYSDMSGSYGSITSNGKSISGTSSSSESSSAAASSSAGVKVASSSAGGKGSSSATSSASGSSSTGSSSDSKSDSSSESSSDSTSTGSSDSSATTLTSTVSAATGSATVKAAATTATKPAQSTSTSGAQVLKPKHKYGAIDMGVMALGLGLGYLVM